MSFEAWTFGSFVLTLLILWIITRWISKLEKRIEWLEKQLTLPSEKELMNKPGIKQEMERMGQDWG